MNIPQPELDHALRMVQKGEMQPEEAAQWLLRNSLHVHPPFPEAALGSISVAELMQRLGPPPPDIQKDWDQQVALLGQSFLSTFGIPLRELSASDLRIDADNRLSFTSAFINRRAAIRQSHPIKDLPSKTKSSRVSDRRRWLIPSVVYGVAFGLMGLTLYLLLPRASSDTAIDTRRESPRSQASAKQTSIFSPTTEGPSQPFSPKAGEFVSEPTDGPLETIEIPALAAEHEDISRATMGLDSFAGGNWANASQLLPKASFDASVIDSGDEGHSDGDQTNSVDTPAEVSSMPVDSPADGDVDDDSMADDAPDSPILAIHGNTSVILPPIPSRTMAEHEIQPIVVSERKPKDLAISFPVDTGLTVVQNNQRWLVKDDKDQAVVAIFALDGEELRFQWTEDAITHLAAKQISSGAMLTSADDGSTTTTYLRPVINAPAWPMDIATGDAKAAWPIGVSPPVGPSRLSIEFQLPKTMLQTWIQLYEPNKIRRCQSIAEFALDADPTIAIRARIDVRVGTRVSMRIRYAAQLDNEFPWQMISSDRVIAAASQINVQLAQAIREQSELKSLYSNANSSEKRVIAARREMNDLVVPKLQTLSKRLALYESLLSQLQAEATLALRLVVDWPEVSNGAVQTIFEMQPQAGTKLENQAPEK